jgi:hypothetical protein
MVTVSRRRLLALCLVVMLLPAGAGAGRAETAAGGLGEYQIKAAYLYYFTTFVEWAPETYSRTGEALVIGLLGVDPFGSILDDTVRGKSFNNRKIVVRRFASLKDVRDCHVLFISASERDRLPSILKTLEGAAVLTVGDLDRFAVRGGQIEFRTEEKKVRFDINVSAVEKAHLKVSAQLMKLGRIVDATGHQGG